MSDELGRRRKGDAEPFDIGSPNAFLLAARDERDSIRVRLCEAFDKRPCAVWGTVIDDEQLIAGTQSEDPLDERANRARLVVRWYHDADRRLMARLPGRIANRHRSGVGQLFAGIALSAREMKRDLRQQSVDIEWLGQCGIGIGKLFRLVSEVAAGGHRHDGNIGRFRIALETPDGRGAVDRWKHDVHQDEIRTPVPRQHETLRTVSRNRNRITLTCQNGFDQIGHGRLVFDYQDALWQHVFPVTTIVKRSIECDFIDVGTERLELGHHLFVATIDVIDIAHVSFA